ncbi:MAG TPA: methylmalonyl Co-A mutase-associated GTPase MeaB [Jatrophihabitans sp.]|nr:methylmalonyl Co-A mutase-associated GTPase MeaB [Jatrophihabitans sp.]
MSELVSGVRAGNRAAIARAITLVESSRGDHAEEAQRLLAELLPDTGNAQRVGISGVPGVGKSTFIDQLGVNLIAEGHRVAVLAVDPSSGRTGGSILGDKTRMARLAADEHAFVRPSPSAGTLGGVAKATRETMLVMEAAGYDIVLVETVGVGQSEYVVADMVDTFLYLTLARTGDQLQGMKRGILELADVIAVNKSDEEHEKSSQKAARELSGALRLLRGGDEDWQAPVVTCSGLHNIDLDRVWKHVLRHREWLESHGGLERKRREQMVQWTRSMVRDRLLARLTTAGVRDVVREAEQGVRAGELTPDQAAGRILAALDM